MCGFAQLLGKPAQIPKTGKPLKAQNILIYHFDEWA